MIRRLSIPVGIMLAVAALGALSGGYAATSPATAANDQDLIVSINGLIHLDDADAIVEKAREIPGVINLRSQLKLNKPQLMGCSC